MKTAIIGAGIMGSTLGSYLAEAGAKDVWLVDPFKAHIDAINERGLDVIGYSGKEWTKTEKTLRINAVTSPEQIGETVDFVFYCVKMPHLKEAVRQAKCISGQDTIHISLLNGIGSADVLLEEYEADHVAYGVVHGGGAILAPGKLHRDFRPGVSEIIIGLASKNTSEKLDQFAELLSVTECPFLVRENVDYDVWAKMINNCVGNSICAVTRMTLGTLFNDLNAVELADKVEAEVRAVAKAEGVEIPSTGKNFGKFPKEAQHVPSTAQDIINKKQTEIETINGAVCALGRKHGIPTPYNDCLTLLVNFIQANFDTQVGVI